MPAPPTGILSDDELEAVLARVFLTKSGAPDPRGRMLPRQLQPREALPDKEQGGTNYLNDSSCSKDTRMRVTTAEFIKGYGTLADKALIEPVTITKNGRDRLVLVSIEEYERLRRRDRRAFRTEDLSEADIALIAQAEAPPEHAHLDEELGDWRP